MSKLANLVETIDNARTILGKKKSFAWNVFDQVNGKRTSAEISKILNKQHTNVSYKLGHLEDMGLLQEKKKKENATIYQKIPELKNLKYNSRTTQKTAKIIQQEQASCSYSKVLNETLRKVLK